VFQSNPKLVLGCTNRLLSVHRVGKSRRSVTAYGSVLTRRRVLRATRFPLRTRSHRQCWVASRATTERAEANFPACSRSFVVCRLLSPRDNEDTLPRVNGNLSGQTRIECWSEGGDRFEFSEREAWNIKMLWFTVGTTWRIWPRCLNGNTIQNGNSVVYNGILSRTPRSMPLVVWSLVESRLPVKPLRVCWCFHQ
jgi:hypothetical protein